MTGTAWIAADWGTSNLRVWLMDAEGAVLAERRSDTGMGQTAPDAFEAAFLGLVGDALPDRRVTPVIVCGMAGAKQGWAEAQYAAAPCPPPRVDRAVRVATADKRIDVRILPGVRQDRPADVMRGEETQIAGFLARTPNFDGVLCMPGTHTKWVHISAGEIVSFQTFMTGELFAFLSRQSVLRHAMGTGSDPVAFDAAVSDAMAHPATLAARLFGIRADSLLHGLAPDTARSRLSGYLIGVELAGARPYWLGQRVAIFGQDQMSMSYAAALAAQGVQAETVAAEALTLDGLRAAWRAMALQ